MSNIIKVKDINGNWIGIPAIAGITPHIGENGNWFIGAEDTGVNAGGGSGGASISSYKYEARIPAAGWTNAAPYMIDINVTGITEDDYPNISVIQDADMETAKAQLAAFNCIDKIETFDGKITCSCYTSIPTIEIPILIRGVK